MEPDLETLFLVYRRDRDLEALATLFDRVAPHLLKVAQHLAPDRSAAEDLVQETFLVVLKDAQAFEEGRRLVPWLVGILVNRARILHRALRRGLDEERLARTLLPGPEAEAQAREFMARLDETLARIDEPYREVLRLHLKEECAPAEVARLLGRPQSTVRTQLQRGLRLLRRLLPGGLLPGVAPVALRSLARIRRAVLAQAAAGSAVPPALVRAGAKRLLLTGFGAVLLTCLGLFLASRLGDRAPDPHEAGPPLAARSPEIPATPPGPPDLPGASPRKAVEPQDDPAKRFHVQPADGWLVEVVKPKGETDNEFEAVPFAEVCFLHPNLVEGLYGYQNLIEGWANLALPLEESYRSIGLHYQADVEGRLRVPRVFDWAPTAFGWKEGLWGRATLPLDGIPPFRLVLRPDASLRVQVVNVSGHPVEGIPVSLVGVLWNSRATPPMRTEGPEGIVEFRRVKTLLEEEWAITKLPDHSLYVQLMIPLPNPVFQRFDAAQLPVEPIRLVLPPTGSVVVEVDGPHDLPAGGRIRAGIGGWCTADAVNGIARFPHVGLGLELQVKVQQTLPLHMGPLSRSQEQVGPGPTLTGEEVRFRFPVSPGFPLLAGHVVDQDGGPVALRSFNYSFFLQVEGMGQSAIPSRMRTDKEGRFLVPVHEEYRPRSPAYLLLTTPGPTLEGSLELPLSLRPGRNEVGTVVLAHTRLLAAGRLVDREGPTITGVPIQFSIPDPVGSREESSFSNRILNHLEPQTDQEGRFSTYSSFPRFMDLERICIQVHLLGYLPLNRIVPVGTQGLELVLERAATLDGSLILPDGADPGDFILEAHNPSHSGAREWFARLFPDGRFRFPGIQPGEITFQVRLRSGEVVHEEVGIKVEGGKITSDPRLQGIDLRGRFLVVELEVVDSSGAPVASGRVYRLGAPNPIGEIVRGKARLLVPPGGIDLEVACPGHRNLVVRAVGSSRKLVLEPSPPTDPGPGGGREGGRAGDR